MQQIELVSPEQNKPTRNWEWLFLLLLIAILLVGAAFRLTGVNWDEDQHLHPDERFLTMVETSLSFPGDAKGADPREHGVGEIGRIDLDVDQ